MIEINITEYQGFVRQIASHHKRRNVDISDAVAFGNRALLHAAERFNPDIGKPFRAYAYTVIKRAIWKLMPDSPDCEVSENPDKFSNGEETPTLLNRRKALLTLKLEQLPERERLIIKKSFGIDCEEQTYREIAKELGIAHQRVHQLKTRGMGMLKQLLTEADNA